MGTKPTFSDRVIQLALSIPPGKVTTYGKIARAAGGGAMASQSITAILSKAYEGGLKGIPFHRIVYADGRVWMSPTQESQRRTLYKREGIKIDTRGRIENFADVLLEFD